MRLPLAAVMAVFAPLASASGPSGAPGTAAAPPPSSGEVCGAPVIDGYVTLADGDAAHACLRAHLLTRQRAFLARLGPSGLRAGALPPERLSIVLTARSSWLPGPGVQLGLDSVSRAENGRRRVHLPSLEAHFAHETGHELLEGYVSYRRVQEDSYRPPLGHAAKGAIEDLSRGIGEMTGDLLASAWARDGAVMSRPGPFASGAESPPAAFRDYSRPQAVPSNVGSHYQLYADVGSRLYGAIFAGDRYAGRQGAALHAALTAVERLGFELESTRDPSLPARFGLKPDPAGRAHLYALIDEELGKASLPALP